MGIVFSKEQNDVINLRNRNILVSAAAGSGKTAVLVERILRKLEKIDIDRFIVVTFGINQEEPALKVNVDTIIHLQIYH